MAIQVECPRCKDRNSLKNNRCKKCDSEIKKASGKTYWINYRDPSKRLRFEKIGPSKQSAENRLREIKTAIAEDRYIDKNLNVKYTFGDLIEWFLGLTDTRSKKSYKRIAIALANVERILGSGILVSQLKPSHMETYKKKRLLESSSSRKGKTIAPDTVNKEITFAKVTLNKAVAESEIESNPFACVKILPANNVRERVLSFGEFEQLVFASPEYLQPIITMAFYMPMRQGELVSLTWDCVDLKRGFITLSAKITKTGKGRMLKIHPQVIKLLQNLPRGIGSRRVFLNDGVPVHQRQLQRNYTSAVKKAKLGDFTFHDLRHCAINNMRLAGNDYFMIMAQSGHRTMSVFKRYNLVSETELENTKWLDESAEKSADVDLCVDQENEVGKEEVVSV